MAVFEAREIPHHIPQTQESPGYYQAPHHPHYGYGDPKHSCKVKNIVKNVEVCTPAFETVCETEEIQVKKIVDKEMCFPVTRTVCTESISVEETELCTFSYNQRTKETEAEGVEVSFTQECGVQTVTRCPPRGYDGQPRPCEETDRPSWCNRPEVTPVRPPGLVTHPAPSGQVCVNKNISLPDIHCLEDTHTQTCVIIPEVHCTLYRLYSTRLSPLIGFETNSLIADYFYQAETLIFI